MITRRNATGSNGRRVVSRRLFLPARGCWFSIGLILAACAGTLRGQSVTEFDVPYATTLPREITAGADGNLWFADYEGPAVIRVTPAGVFTRFPTPTLGPHGVTLGPDGNVWYTEFLYSKVGRITPAGVMTEFALPCLNPPLCYLSSGPAGIVAGPDGNLWTAEGVGKIGRVTTAGTATDFDVPSSKGNPSGIAAGADGNLWFTESFANRIGRITTSGTVTEFPIPTTNSAPGGIASGPDGNLWFTELNGNKIARITTSGIITEFPIPTAATLPTAITAGPDGNLWFTELGNQIGRITPAGEITEYPLPAFSSAFGNGIVSGPDGSLWLTRATSTAARITRFTPPPPAAAARFYALTPCRLVDTRNPTAGNGGPALRAGLDRLFTLAGTCGIPSSARALAINATVTGGTASGHLTAYPAGTILPLASLINYGAGQTRANNGVLALGAGGTVEVHCGQTSGTVQFILDVNGYFQ
jgi:streptogramin lyase